MTYESYMMLCYIGAGLSALMFVVSVILFVTLKINTVINSLKKASGTTETNNTQTSSYSGNTALSGYLQDVSKISFDIPGFSIEQSVIIINTDEKIDT